MSHYLGDEVVIVGVKQTDSPGFAVIADVQKSGLDDFLSKQFAPLRNPRRPSSYSMKPLWPRQLSPKATARGYALIRAARSGLLQQRRDA